MRFATEEYEIKEIKHYLELAAKEAIKSTCKKSQRGAVVVEPDYYLGLGYNKVTDEIFCNPCIREHIQDNSSVEQCSAIHAEQMAIFKAAIYCRNADLSGSRLYHIKVKDGKMVPSGKPSCTVCSRMIVESGISEVVLWHPEGYAIYDSKEFNELSFKYLTKK
jgi:deoxycytidylate deaminase